MRILDRDGAQVENPDLGLGRLEEDSVFVRHHEAEPERQRIETLNYNEPYYVDERTGGKLIRTVVEQEYAPARDSWDEYEDILRYIPYTQEELDEIAAANAAEAEAARIAAEQSADAARQAANRETFLVGAPERVDGLEMDSLDHDEAITALYEQAAQSQLDTDEALVNIYETMLEV